ncbi:ribonuclease P protein component [Tateyamaria omphalii]|uniref:ribonuclease P protein component n=1 Tax=Tateyamaria omphalii TaxID=299262 RepID=UPI001C99937A|nr:ribonuclease P protein component [Tateyamaria omphalii]MBY5931424.1 ribonuclease P protein component [Tateyamaria omphalii]
MTPPEASLPSIDAGADTPPAGPLRLETLKKRADFLRAARGRRVVMPGFILQARSRDDDGPIRVGFTCSKKVGNAVARNRAKRRLREVARHVLSRSGAPATDYVFVGRAKVTASRPFNALIADCAAALERLS